MSVRTTADKRLEDANEHLNQAYKAILEALDSNTWGSDQYCDKFVKRLEKMAVKISTMKSKLP